MFITNKKNRHRTVLRGPFICRVCGKEFYRYIGPQQAKKVRVCSKKCLPKYIHMVRPLKGEYRNCKRCGKKFFAQAREDRRGYKRGYCSLKCFNPHYGTGRTIGSDGYWIVMVNGKPTRENRYIMEKHLKRKLKPSELVHHENGDKLDNRISNLFIVSRSEHNLIHAFRHGKYLSGHRLAYRRELVGE